MSLCRTVILFNNTSIWFNFLLNLVVGIASWFIQKALWVVIMMLKTSLVSILLEAQPSFMPQLVMKFFNAILWILKGLLFTVVFPEVKADFITYGYIPRAATSLPPGRGDLQLCRQPGPCSQHYHERRVL